MGRMPEGSAHLPRQKCRPQPSAEILIQSREDAGTSTARFVWDSLGRRISNATLAREG